MTPRNQQIDFRIFWFLWIVWFWQASKTSPSVMSYQIGVYWRSLEIKSWLSQSKATSLANNLNLFLSLVKSLRYSGSSGAYECRLISLSNSIFAFIILFNSMEVFWLFHKCLRTVTSYYIPFIYFSIINIFFLNIIINTIMKAPEGSKTDTIQMHCTDALYKCIKYWVKFETWKLFEFA